MESRNFYNLLEMSQSQKDYNFPENLPVQKILTIQNFDQTLVKYLCIQNKCNWEKHLVTRFRYFHKFSTNFPQHKIFRVIFVLKNNWKELYKAVPFLLGNTIGTIVIFKTFLTKHKKGFNPLLEKLYLWKMMETYRPPFPQFSVST